jgi:hypothetical protein
MRTFLDYHVINFYGGYNVHVDREGTMFPCGWIPAGQLQMNIDTYLDIEDNEVYVRYQGEDDYTKIGGNEK